MNFKQLTLLIGLMLTGTAVFAGPAGNYWAVGLTSVTFDASTGDELDANGFTIQYGRDFFRLFGIEAHIGSARDNSTNVFGNKADYTYFAVLGRINLPLDRVNLYALGGVSQIDFDFGAIDGDDDEAALGIGIDLFASENSALSIQAMRYGDDNSLDTLIVAYKQHFSFWGK